MSIYLEASFLATIHPKLWTCCAQRPMLALLALSGLAICSVSTYEKPKHYKTFQGIDFKFGVEKFAQAKVVWDIK